MAFNPFDVFRRNQKILFAGLTVVVMFMFVLSFGQGDFFQRVPQWIGSRQRTGDVLAVVDGSKLYGSEIGRLETNRQIANQYMAVAASRAANNLGKSITDSASRVSPENRQLFQELTAVRPFYFSLQMQQIVGQFGGTIPPQFQQFFAQDRDQTIGRLQAGIQQILAAKSPKENDLEVAKAAQSLMALDEVNMAARGLYFFNQPNRDTRDLVEFYLWLKKADALGIKLTDADVAALVNDECLHKLTNDDLREAEAGAKQRGQRGYSPDQLRSALADEFRVRAAQAAVLGPDYVRVTGRFFDAPSDYFNYYREQCSPGRFGFISLPAANFTEQVKGEPSETELRDLFQRAKGLEPSPMTATVGLREPRKLKLEWVEVKGDEPYYQTAAAEGIQKADAMAKVGGFFVAPVNGGALAALLAAPATLYKMPDAVLEAKYKEYVKDQQDVALRYWYSQPFALEAPKVLDAFAVRPADLSAVAGPALPAAVGFENERKARTRTLAAALGAPVATGMPSALLAVVAAEAVATRPLPIDAVRGQLVEKAKVDFARTIANGDLRTFETEEAKLAGKDAEAKALADKFVKDRGLKTGRSAGFYDQYAIVDDPGLAPLKDRLLATGLLHGGGYVNPVTFGHRFFFEPDLLSPGREQPATRLYKPQPYPQAQAELTAPLSSFFPAESVFLVWRTAEEEAVSPRDFNSPGAKEKTLAVWRQLKARDLAKQAAENLAKDCQNLGAGYFEIEQKLRDKQAALAAQFKTPAEKAAVKFFDRGDVAPIISRSGGGMMAMGQDQVQAYRVEESAEFPYPTRKMAEDLIAAKEKPLSTAVVLVDGPETTYYVAVLMNRREQTVDEFSLKVYNPLTGRSQLEDVIARGHQAEVRKQSYDTALALLKAEFRYEEKNEAAMKQRADTSGE